MLLTEWDTEEAKLVWREEGFEDGLEKGLEKGREEGIEKTKVEAARNLKALGIPTDIIVKSIGLPPEEIAKL